MDKHLHAYWPPAYRVWQPGAIHDDKEEVLTVQGNILNKKVRFINAYGPQENTTDEVKETFFCKMDEEIKSAQMAGTLICIEMDANSKMGSEIIPGDPNHQSRNGKYLQKMIEENNLICVNGTDLCERIITRFRKTINTTERSVIDYFIVCKQFFNLNLKMIVDEDRKYSLTKYSTRGGQKEVKESDHNPLFLKLHLKWRGLNKKTENWKEIFNFRHSDHFKIFQTETENNEELLKCFEDETKDPS